MGRLAMAQFMLFLHHATTGGPDMSPEEMQAVLGKYREWSEKMGAAGKLVGGDKLANDAGHVLRIKNDKVSVVDGPYSETKEMVGGYFKIEAADYDEAVELAGTCPHLSFGGTIELRAVDQM